jgi:hypothetical protein
MDWVMNIKLSVVVAGKALEIPASDLFAPCSSRTWSYHLTDPWNRKLLCNLQFCGLRVLLVHYLLGENTEKSYRQNVTC